MSYRKNQRNSANALATYSRAAYTLLELAVVLVIIGLLLGSIFQGKALLHKAELQSVIRDFGKYRDAVNQFKLAYEGLPGDVFGTAATDHRAADIWGSAGGNGSNAACFAAITAGSPLTCNGDGNGYIGGPFTVGALTKQEEVYTAWQQLANAHLIEGNYSGPNGNVSIPGINVPAGQISGSGYTLISQNPIQVCDSAVTDAAECDKIDGTDNPYFFYGDYGSVARLNSDNTYKINPGVLILFGAPSANGLTDGELLSPKDAYFIDKKTDDGLPAEGQIMTYLQYADDATNPNICVVKAGGGTLAASDDKTSGPGTITYNFPTTSPACNLLSIIDSRQVN